MCPTTDFSITIEKSVAQQLCSDYLTSDVGRNILKCSRSLTRDQHPCCQLSYIVYSNAEKAELRFEQKGFTRVIAGHSVAYSEHMNLILALRIHCFSHRRVTSHTGDTQMSHHELHVQTVNTM